MEDFLRKVIGGNTVTPPEACIEAFSFNFNDAINVEWSVKGLGYEAVFYKDHIEYIAQFDSSGTLEKYKMYLTKELLPELIKIDLEGRGEIMNVVLINEGNHILYEVIIRDRDLKRYLILVTQIGQIVEERPL